MPISVTWPIYRNVNDEDYEESSLGISLRGMYISSVSLEWRSHEQKTQRRDPIMTEIFRLSSEMR